MSEELLCPICGKSVQSVNHTPDCQHTLKEILDYSHALRKQLELAKAQFENVELALDINDAHKYAHDALAKIERIEKEAGNAKP